MTDQDDYPLGWAPHKDGLVALFNEDGEHVGYRPIERECHAYGPYQVYCEIEPRVARRAVRPARRAGRARRHQRSSKRPTTASMRAAAALDAPSDPAPPPLLDGMTPAERRRWESRAKTDRLVRQAREAEAQMIEDIEPDAWITVTARGGVADWMVRSFLTKLQRKVYGKHAVAKGARLASWVDYEGGPLVEAAEGRRPRIGYAPREARHAHIHVNTEGKLSLAEIQALWKHGKARAERPRSVAATARYSVKVV